MKHAGVKSAIVFCMLSLGLFATGGCPLVLPETQLAPSPEPGTHYVARIEGELFYLQFPEVRGERHQWIELYGEGEWYTGEGFYQLSEDYVWSRDQEIGDLTIDDLIQLYDPPPPVPE